MDNNEHPTADPAGRPQVISVSASVARTFVETWSGELAADLAERLNCQEAEALADLLRALGAHESAAAWIDIHAEDDDEDDEHVSWLDGKDAYRWRPAPLAVQNQEGQS